MSTAPQISADTAVGTKPASRARRWGLFALKFAVAAGAFAYVLTRQPWADLEAALARITPLAVFGAIALQLLGVTLAAVRWRMLLAAYGAQQVPPFFDVLRVYFVGNFYNIYLPGALSGDVLRGLVLRRCFPDGGATASIAIVFVERLFGLLTVMSMVSLAAPFDHDGQLARKVLPYALLGIGAVVAAVFVLAQARRVAPYVPRRLAPFVRSLPALSRPWLLLPTLLSSFVIQGVFVVFMHLLVASAYPATRWSDSLVVVPLTALASYFPLSIAGAGPRDAVLVALYAIGGVPRSAGVAASLALLVVVLVVAATGGLWQLLAPLDRQPARAGKPAA